MILFTKATSTQFGEEWGRRLDVLGDIEATPHLISPREARRERPERAVGPASRGGEGGGEEFGRGHRAVA